jgi:hypothetical protein
MSWPQFAFAEALPVGHSKHLRKLRQRQIRSHAAAVSAHRINEEPLSRATYGVASFKSPSDVLAATDVPENDASTSFLPRLQVRASDDTYPDRSLIPAELPKTTHEEEYVQPEPRSEHSVAATILQATDPSPEPPTGPLVFTRKRYPAIPSDHHGFRKDPFNCIPARGSRHLSDVLDYCKVPQIKNDLSARITHHNATLQILLP